MLERSEYMPLEYFRKQRWTGSYQGMRFLFHKITECRQEKAEGEAVEQEQVWLEVVIWKEPYSYECTPEEEKIRQRFLFSEEGRERAIVWLEEEYDKRREEWKAMVKWKQ